MVSRNFSRRCHQRPAVGSLEVSMNALRHRSHHTPARPVVLQRAFVIGIGHETHFEKNGRNIRSQKHCQPGIPVTTAKKRPIGFLDFFEKQCCELG